MAKLEGDHEVSAGIPDGMLLDAAFKKLRKLVWAARISGGTAGPDEGLMEACEEAEQLIENHGGTYGLIPQAQGGSDV